MEKIDEEQCLIEKLGKINRTVSCNNYDGLLGVAVEKLSRNEDCSQLFVHTGLYWLFRNSYLSTISAINSSEQLHSSLLAAQKCVFFQYTAFSGRLCSTLVIE